MTLDDLTAEIALMFLLTEGLGLMIESVEITDAKGNRVVIS